MVKSEEYMRRYQSIIEYLDENEERIKQEKHAQDLRRYESIVYHFYKHLRRKDVKPNPAYLEDLNKILEKKGYKELRDDLTFLLSKTLDGKVGIVLNKPDVLTLRTKLKSIESSRRKKEKTNFSWVNPISYSIDEFIGGLI